MSLTEQPMCLSGGADGADLQWGMCAGMAGHIVRHFIFKGHRSKAPSVELVTLTDKQLREADEHLAKANETLGRSWPISKEFVANLLRRNFYQVAYSDAVYAVASIDKRGLVTGGTAWAVQMFIDRHQGNLCAAYVYDQETSTWMTWEGFWVPIASPPVPSGVWAGIGSRDLKDNGKNAIRSLMGYKKPGE